jgi:hypothetical protein
MCAQIIEETKESITAILEWRANKEAVITVLVRVLGAHLEIVIGDGRRSAGRTLHFRTEAMQVLYVSPYKFESLRLT